MREQILKSFAHRNFSIMVVGNKFDLIADTNSHSQVCLNKIRFNLPEFYFIAHTLICNFLFASLPGIKRYFDVSTQTLALRICGVFCKVSIFEFSPFMMSISCGICLLSELFVIFYPFKMK